MTRGRTQRLAGSQKRSDGRRRPCLTVVPSKPKAKRCTLAAAWARLYPKSRLTQTQGTFISSRGVILHVEHTTDERTPEKYLVSGEVREGEEMSLGQARTGWPPEFNIVPSEESALSFND